MKINNHLSIKLNFLKYLLIHFINLLEIFKQLIMVLQLFMDHRMVMQHFVEKENIILEHIDFVFKLKN